MWEVQTLHKEVWESVANCVTVPTLSKVCVEKLNQNLSKKIKIHLQGVAGKLKISLDFFDRFQLSFLHQLSQSWFFTQLTFGNCVKIPNFGKCENWKNIHNQRKVTASSQLSNVA